MGNIVHIEESTSLKSVEYDIVVGRADGDEPTIVARCWDYFLAEKIRETVERYMEENAAS